MIQIRENGKKPHFEPHLGWFGPNSCHQKLFIKLVVIVPSYHPTQFKGKLMNQTWENCEKPYFRAYFGLFGPNLDPKFFWKHFSSTKFRYFRKLSSHALSSNTYDPSPRKWQKKLHFGPDLGLLHPHPGHQHFFSKIWHCQ